MQVELPSGPTANDVTYDVGDLAARARTTLAGADIGRLVAETGSGVGVQAVRIVDDAGEPLLVCARTDELVAAATGGRRAVLQLDPTPTRGVRLRLGGRLSRLDEAAEATGACDTLAARTWRLVGPDEVLIALRVDRIEAGCPHEMMRSPLAAHRPIPLSLYARAEPDHLAANIPRITQHLNAHHGEQLRALAADLTARRVADIAVASIVELHRSGARIAWIDDSGAHDRRIEFPEVATTLPALVRAIDVRVQAATDRLTAAES